MNIKKTYAILIGTGLLCAGSAFAQTAPIQLQSTITTNQEVATLDPSTPAQSGGTAQITYYPDTHMLTYHIAFHDLSGPASKMHFHQGAKGQDGPHIFVICDGDCPNTKTGTVEGTWNDVSDAYAQELLNDNVFINIHTALNPAGETRGQVTS